MSAVATRFGEWLDWLGLPQREVAARIGCAQSFVSQIRMGKKRPGREHSQNIEAASATWPRGPIRATEWNTIEKAAAGSRKRAA